MEASKSLNATAQTLVQLADHGRIIEQTLAAHRMLSEAQIIYKISPKGITLIFKNQVNTAEKQYL